MVTVKLTVDNGVCEGHGQCNMVNEELFTLDEDGYSTIGKGKPVPAGMEDDADAGVYNCPVGALSIEA